MLQQAKLRDIEIRKTNCQSLTVCAFVHNMRSLVTSKIRNIVNLLLRLFYEKFSVIRLPGLPGFYRKLWRQKLFIEWNCSEVRTSGCTCSCLTAFHKSDSVAKWVRTIVSPTVLAETSLCYFISCAY